MFKIGIAHSLTSNMQVAAKSLAEQALLGLDGHAPSAALLFSTFGRDHATLLAQLHPLLPGCTLVGGSSNGEVSRKQGYRVGSALLILFASDSIHIRAGVLRDLTFDNDTANLIAAQQQLPLRRLGGNQPGPEASPVLGLLFPDGMGLNGESVVQLFASQFPGTRFFGGASAENFNLGPTEQFFNQEVLHNAVPYLLFYGALRYHWGVTEGLTSGWMAVGERLDAQCQGKWIKTIASKPATDFLEARYRLSGGLLSVCHPFVIYPKSDSDDHVFRDVIRYDETTGALESIQLLPDDCQIQLTQPDPAAILQASQKNTLLALTHFPGNDLPAGVLWFSCVSRALVLQHDPASEFRTAMQGMPDALPVAGFYAYGEIAPGGPMGGPTYHSSTLVTLMLGEEPRPSLGMFAAQDSFSLANLTHDNRQLTEQVRTLQTDLAAARSELGHLRDLGRIAAHSKTELNFRYRALALDVLCELIETRYADFKRSATKGDPPKLNKSGLARLINEQHVQRTGQPFPLTQAQLARLLGPQNPLDVH